MMNLFRTLCLSTALVVGTAGLNSCLSPPDFSETPEISFKETRKEYIDNGPGIAPDINLYFVLNFRDGDGDLGLSPEDLQNPPFFPNVATNPNYFNYFIQPFRLENGVFVPFNAGTTYNSVFNFGPEIPRLEKPAPLKGELVYKLPFSPDGFQVFPGDTFRFEIYIRDRALHVSNRITTSPVVLSR